MTGSPHADLVQKRRRREYRQAQKNRFKRPSPGFSLYEGRTRGKRVKYTYSDDEESWTDSTRRSTRNTGTHTPAEPSGPLTTASGRQVRAPTRLEAEGNTSAAPSVQGDDSENLPEDVSFGASGRPRRSAAANHGTNGWGRSSRSRGFSADEMDDDEDVSEPDLGDDEEDGDDHVPEESEDEEDEFNEDEMMVDDDLEDQPRGQLIVELKVNSNKAKLPLANLTPSPENKCDTAQERDITSTPSKEMATAPAAASIKDRTPEPETSVAAKNQVPAMPASGLQATPLAFRGSPEKTQKGTNGGDAASEQ